MKELLVRTGTSVLFVGVLVGAVLWTPLSTAALFFLFTVVGCHEYFRMMRSGASVPPSELPGYISGTMAFAAPVSYTLWDCSLPLFLLPLLPPFLLILEMPRKREAPFHRAALSLFGPLFFGISFGLLLAVREASAGGPGILLGILILIWIHDSAAYLFGKLLGRQKLWPRISPGKTWEGSGSGALFCIAAAWLLPYLLPDWSTRENPMLLGLAFPLTVIVLGTLGDLSISLLKRSTGFKDTGHILPGHGGVLDRFDALLMSSPAFFALLMLFG
jgi:phosphatidate cytidylyltransferase